MPFDGFVLAMSSCTDSSGGRASGEQYDWIQAEVNSPDDEDVTLSDWAQFHERFCERGRRWTISAHFAIKKKPPAPQPCRTRPDSRGRESSRAAAARQRPEQATRAALRLVGAEGVPRPRRGGRTGPLLEPGAWDDLTAGVGRRHDALEQIRRRRRGCRSAARSTGSRLAAGAAAPRAAPARLAPRKSLLASRARGGTSAAAHAAATRPRLTMDKFVGESEARLGQPLGRSPCRRCRASSRATPLDDSASRALTRVLDNRVCRARARHEAEPGSHACWRSPFRSDAMRPRTARRRPRAARAATRS